MEDPAFFIASKLFWAVIRPEALLLALLTAAALLMLAGRLRTGRALTVAALAALWSVALLPVDRLVLVPLESRFPADPPLGRLDGVLVLGGAAGAAPRRFPGLPQLSEAGERLVAGAALAHAHPEARLVFTGGTAQVARLAEVEADEARRVFEALGVAPARIVLERRSHNTVENAAFSREMLDPKPGERWALVTSAFHMPRAVGVFCQQGWRVLPYPVDFRTGDGFGLRFAARLANLEFGVKEWIGLVAYRLTGRSAALFPEGC